MEKKICKKCGRELPISEFSNLHFGVSCTCKECTTKSIKEGRSKKNEIAILNEKLEGAMKLRLADFTPRELLSELKSRGYRWERMTVTQVVDYNKI